MDKEKRLKSIDFLRKYKDDLLLTKKEIDQYNQTISEKACTLYDLFQFSSLGQRDILEYICQYNIPNSIGYTKEGSYSLEDIQAILENRNICEVKDQKFLQKGILVKRSNVRSFPTNRPFYNRKDTVQFDRFQETELAINTPVLILHESKDKIWNFVLSPIYAGWVLKENIALATEEDWNFFIQTTSFGVILEPTLCVDGVLLDMGVRLPMVLFNGQNTFVLPVKNSENMVGKKRVSFFEYQVHIGYLPYTERNIALQAFKYENVPYSWGGLDQNVDCSSFVMNVYKTFGFQFPRNTSVQSRSVGKVICLEGKSIEEKQILFSENDLCLLYQPGHVMFNLGKMNGEIYIFHASGGELKVTLTNLTKRPDVMEKINKMVLVHE